MHPYRHLSIHPSIYTSFHHLSIHLYIHLSMHSFILSSIHPSIHQHIYIQPTDFVHTSTRLLFKTFIKSFWSQSDPRRWGRLSPPTEAWCETTGWLTFYWLSFARVAMYQVERRTRWKDTGTALREQRAFADLRDKKSTGAKRCRSHSGALWSLIPGKTWKSQKIQHSNKRMRGNTRWVRREDWWCCGFLF